MYYIFVENKNLNGCGTCKCSDNGILNFEVDKNVFENYKTEPLKFTFQNNKIVENPDFTNLKQKIQKQQMKENLKQELDELDKKRIRAICENEVKDNSSGQTWLEFYNNKIQELRSRLNCLN